MITVEDIARHLGMTAVPQDTDALDRVLATTRALFAEAPYVRAPSTPGDEAVLDQAQLIVAGDLWRRKDAPGGVYVAGDGTDAPAYLSRDPLLSARSLLVQAGLWRAWAVG